MRLCGLTGPPGNPRERETQGRGGGNAVFASPRTTWDQSMFGMEDAGVADVTTGAGGCAIVGALGKVQEHRVLGLGGEAGPGQMAAAKNAGKIPTMVERASQLPGQQLCLDFPCTQSLIRFPLPCRGSTGEEGDAGHTATLNFAAKRKVGWVGAVLSLQHPLPRGLGLCWPLWETPQPPAGALVLLLTASSGSGGPGRHQGRSPRSGCCSGLCSEQKRGWLSPSAAGHQALSGPLYLPDAMGGQTLERGGAHSPIHQKNPCLLYPL